MKFKHDWGKENAFLLRQFFIDMTAPLVKNFFVHITNIGRGMENICYTTNYERPSEDSVPKSSSNSK